ncbi:patatin-like phospholipase family protein [Paucibacter sp. Y2R2-4]|uniref:patatin-like phospholipase family protein n=1 Tax=Paucibacter sp. Y2R2-4 TaxID=2893553 RepID=UPI0021E381D9|nr:patatin-like phospholipase family protein [Paucibacter sp. Y2R2-4]MCV2351222.1 patatin-like phospholipase family protein [Paucibacter sp. Y2R2-4]
MGRLMKKGLLRANLALLLLAAGFLLSACSSYRPWINQPRAVSAQEAAAAPQASPVRPVVVAVALSGGGARAAAFGLGVLKGLKAAEFELPDRRTNLLDEVSLISGVSGGSILAAHFAAFGDECLERFESDFLLAPFEGRLLRELLWPERLYQLSSPWYGRTQILAERLDELYRGMSFADARRRPGAPELMITATDLTTGAPFDFTAEQFELICSDLDNTPLSFAVAASSAVPLLLSPVTVRNYAGHCPLGPVRTLQDGEHSYRTQLLKRSVEGYRNAAERPFVHLVDGGVTDNLGVRLMLDRLVASGSMHANFADAPPGSIRQLVLVTVNSERALAERIDSSDRVPTTGQVLESLIFGAGARDSQVTLGILSDDLLRWRQELARTRGQPGSPFAADAQLHVVNLSLHDERDDRIRDRLLRVPTAFTIEAQDVRELQTAGTRALHSAESFLQLQHVLARLREPPP